MRTFQLDECTNSKKLRRQCKEQGLVDVHSFPEELRNKGVKDPAVLKWLAGLSTPLVTTDAGLKTEHTSDIPDSYPGIVVLCSADRATLTLRDKQALLGKFKNNLAGWDQIDISDVIVEIWKGQEYDVNVTRVESGCIVAEMRMGYEDVDWPGCFVRSVSSRRCPRNLPDART